MDSPKTYRLKQISGTSKEIRLHEADRRFLRDLAKVRILSGEMATKNHYSHLKGGSGRSLDRLEAAGIIRKNTIRVPGRKPVATYLFSSHAMARAWGGKLLVTGAKRNDLHELISSHVYFQLGRPADYRLAADFSAADISAVGGCRPDALYTDPATGETVAVEADSGHYTKNQIVEKLARWESAGLNRFVFCQPRGFPVRVPNIDNLELHQY